MADARKLDIGLVREIYDHWNRGDVEATFAYVHADLEWHNRGVAIERLIGRGRGSGIEVDMHVYELITTRDGLLFKREVFYGLDEALASSRSG